MSNDRFTENVNRIIQESGKTKAHIARKCGYTSTQMSDLLHGRKVIRPEDIAKLCIALDVEPNDLFCYDSATT